MNDMTYDEHSMYVRESFRPMLDKETHDLVYGQAWDLGHSAGFLEVLYYYGDFYGLVKHAIEYGSVEDE